MMRPRSDSVRDDRSQYCMIKKLVAEYAPKMAQVLMWPRHLAIVVMGAGVMMVSTTKCQWDDSEVPEKGYYHGSTALEALRWEASRA